MNSFPDLLNISHELNDGIELIRFRSLINFMALKTSKNHGDSTILSSSSAHSSYNLRRNLSQPDGITKRNSSLRSKKNFHNLHARISN